MKNITELGKMLRKIRVDANENQGDMAENIGISRPWLSAIERGKRGLTYKRCEQIASIYKLSTGELSELKKAAFESCADEDEYVIRLFPKVYRTLSDKDKETIKLILREDQ